MSVTLYELGNELLALQAALEESGGELTPEAESQLDALDLAEASKVEAYCKLIRSLTARAEMFAAEAPRIKAGAQAQTKAADRLKARLKEHLERTGQQRIDAGLFKVRLQRNSAPSVECTLLPRDLPEEFRRVVVEQNNQAIVAAWKDNRELPPGIVVEVGCHLRIQ